MPMHHKMTVQCTPVVRTFAEYDPGRYIEVEFTVQIDGNKLRYSLKKNYI